MARDLKDYLNDLADILGAKARLAGDSVENADIGFNREMICVEFLQKHVPKRFSINVGGDIFGAGQQRSGQIDIVINHDMTMNFLENYKIRCPVESVTSAIAVKSVLTREAIFSALSNLATIPQCDPSVIRLGLLSKGVSEYILSWPSLFIFAFDGVEAETCLEHVTTFYSHHHVPFNRIPRAIVVNRKYIITFVHYSVDNPTIETKFDPTVLKGGKMPESTRGLPLFWMMYEMAKGLSWLDGMYLDYAIYYDEAYKQ